MGLSLQLLLLLEGSKNLSQSVDEPCALNPLIPQEHYRVSLQLSLVRHK